MILPPTRQRPDTAKIGMLPIQTPNEMLQRSPPPEARVSSTDTLETSVHRPPRQKAAEDSFQKAVVEHSGVNGNIHGLLTQCDRSPHGGLQLEDFTRFFKSVVAGSLLEAGAAAEETARVRKLAPLASPAPKALAVSLPFCALGAGLRPHHQPLLPSSCTQETARAQGRSESPWAKVNADGALTLEPHGGPSKPSSVRDTSLEEEREEKEEAAAAASAAAAWAAADFMAAVIAASSLGAGALLLARMAGAASR